MVRGYFCVLLITSSSILQASFALSIKYLKTFITFDPGVNLPWILLITEVI